MRKSRRYCCMILLPLLLLSGCLQYPGKQAGVAEEQNLQEERIPADRYIVVGYSQIGSESDWRNANTESFRSAFTAENGYFLLFEDGQQKQENQLKAVRNFILQDVDYIILDPVVETGWDAVLQEAKDAGIPVILADRCVEVEDESLYTCWVGSDFFAEGENAGRWLSKYLKSQGREGEELQIVTLQGTLESSAQIGRTEGFRKVMETEPGWTMLEYCSGDFVQAKGREVMEYFLDTYEDIDVVVSENDNMTFGAIDAIESAGKTCGADGDIIIISFDAVQAALVAMQEGKINADFECNPLLGPVVSEIIKKLEQGETVDKIQYVDETYYDSAMRLERVIEDRTY